MGTIHGGGVGQPLQVVARDVDAVGMEEWSVIVGVELRDHQARDLELEERLETTILIFE